MKYRYHFVDLNEDILANSGDECMRKYNETHDTPIDDYKGNIEVTNLVTGVSNTMYHVEIL